MTNQKSHGGSIVLIVILFSTDLNSNQEAEMNRSFHAILCNDWELVEVISKSFRLFVSRCLSVLERLQLCPDQAAKKRDAVLPC